jgi:hypothetical protein
MDITERIIIGPNRKISSTKTMSTGVTDSVQSLQKGRYIIRKTIGEEGFTKVKVAYKFEDGCRKGIACKEINKVRVRVQFSAGYSHEKFVVEEELEVSL